MVWGQDREQARRRLARALDEFVLEGIPTNIAFHRWLVNHPEFAAARLSTRFLEEHFTNQALAPSDRAIEIAQIAAALHAHDESRRVTLPATENGAPSRWRWADRTRRASR